MTKKLTKFFKVVIALAITFSLFTFANDGTTVSAKMSGDYSYDILNNGTIEIINYNGSAENLEIPKEIDGKKVTKIGYGAFAECQSLKNVVIPDTVNTIGYWAFSKCTQLESIVIPESIVTLGNSAFFGCSSLLEVVIPSSLKAVSNGAFSDCINLRNVVLPDSIEYIEDSAFSGCKSLQRIDLPESVKEIGSNAFSNCIELKSMEFSDSVVSIGTGAFSGCIELSTLTLSNNLRSLGQYAFKDCISLAEVVLPQSLEALGYATFNGCSSLEKINIPSKITTISDSTFSGCSKLEEIFIPNNVTKLGEYVFSGCVGLKKITIPDSVTEIGAFTFSFCSELEEIKLSANLEVLSDGMFTDCLKLNSVVLPSGMKELGNTAFSGCINLKSVVIPNSVSKLQSRVFTNCKSVVISVVQSSAAHAYAINNDVAYKFIEAGLNLDKTKIDMKVGTVDRLVGILSPYNVLDGKALLWTSSNPNVATISDEGEVKAVGVGTTTINAKLPNGLSAQSIVNVNNIEIPIEKVELNEKTLTLLKGTSQGLRGTITPVETTDNRTLTWTSSDTEIATVTSTGVITARKPGTVTIRVTSSNGKIAECVVTILSEIKTVALNLTAMNLDMGMTQSLRATINPDDTTDAKTLSWVSSNPSVATVDGNGKVTAVAAGVATITVKTVNGRTASCKVNVNAEAYIPIIGVTLDQEKLSLEETATKQVIATINPSNTTEDKTLAWSSSDNQVASVTNGLITAKKAGTATITVTTSNGKTASCVVTVTQKAIAIESVTLDTNSTSLEELATQQLVAVINPSNTTEDKTLAWSSSDNQVASVTNGLITAKKAGTATITVTTSNGKTASCVVTVTQKAIAIESVTLDTNSTSLEELATQQLVAVINPSNTTEDKTLAWSSSDNQVASVTNGLITAKKAGTATITVTTSNGKTADCVVTVTQKTITIESVILDTNSTSLEELATQQLIATINPSNTTEDKTLAWSSSDNQVASVTNGLITAKKAGTATITVTTSNGKTASCVVTVTQKAIAIESVTLDTNNTSLEELATQQLIATINPSNTTEDKTLSWSSSNEQVASVTNGLITAKKAGTVTITVTTSNGKTASCVVTVTKKSISITGIQLDKTTATIQVNESEKLSASILPANTTDSYELVWSSSNPNVASVDQQGNVTGLAVGSADITVTVKGTNFSATATVTVEQKIVVDTEIFDIIVDLAEEAIADAELYQKNDAWDIFLIKYDEAIFASNSGNQALIDKSVTELYEALLNIRYLPNEDLF